ncbi:MAG: flagellar filament capping protein FliD, partial [Gammaproteobacteria bacterium]|nr:flagellar filament capping protein FliD [Gammaproteobacteria bacterium]
MAGISSLGIGSGLDLNGLVASLLTAERSPIENSLNRQESKLTTALTGVGLMKSALSTFQSSIAGLADASSYSTRSGTNSNTDALNATISNDASAGSYSIEIDNLAANQSLATSAYADIDATIGSGEIQIRFGSISGPGFTSFNVNADKTTQTITVDSSNNTLSGLRDEINNGNYGVSASIVNDGTGYRLTLSSDDTGADNAMEISITDTGDANNTDTSGLSALAYNATAANLTQTQAAENASVRLNGLTVTSATNVLDEAIEGVTLTLQQETTADSPIRLNINEDTTEITESITSVADAYNEMITALNELSTAGTESSSAGIMVGDASLRSFTTSVRSMLTRQVEGLTGSITALADVGITTQSDGTLTVDTTRFNQAVSDNPSAAIALFAPLGESTDSLISFNSSGDNSKPGSYNINIT